MGKMRIIKAGALTTIQDLGRTGFQQYGMPVAGAMDSRSLRCANWLVGNPSGEACLECTLTGSTIEFLTDSVIAITGAQIPVLINDKHQKQDRSLSVKKGDVLSFGTLEKGLRFYIAFAGGIDVPMVMNSKSTYLRAKVGGYNGRKIMDGDEISIGEFSGRIKKKKLPKDILPLLETSFTARILPGPEVNSFSFQGIKTFLTEEYVISPASDRMGYRLSGKPIEHLQGADIVSSGIPPGSIQVTGDGQPIIMMADRQTIGGYTKIATVFGPDISVLAQMKPGDRIRFREITLQEAQEIIRQEKLKDSFC